MPHRPFTAILAVLVLGAAGCGGDNSAAEPDTSPAPSGAKAATTPPASGTATASAAATEVAGHRTTVSMTEFAFKPRALSASAGKLRVTAANDGHAEHELVLIRTTRPAGTLPTAGGRASEAGTVGEIGEQQPGQSASHTFTLDPGTYVYICNVPGHYAAGMRGTLTVK
jgi:plastocyanin